MLIFQKSTKRPWDPISGACKNYHKNHRHDWTTLQRGVPGAEIDLGTENLGIEKGALTLSSGPIRVSQLNDDDISLEGVK